MDRASPIADEADFVLEVGIEAPLERVRETLCDLEALSPLHPLIESIEELPPREDLPGARHYRVVDRIPMGPFRLRTVYRAALERVADAEVHGHAWQSPGVRLHTVYSLREEGQGTRLVERARVTAPRGLRRFVVGQARAAHRETLAGLKSMLEARE